MLCWFLPYNSVNQPYIMFSHIWLSVTPWTAACQVSLSITNSGACSNSCLSSQWCHPTISSSVIPFFSCLQSFLASGFFPMSQFFASGGQSIGVSTSSSVLPMNIQDCMQPGFTVHHLLPALAQTHVHRVGDAIQPSHPLSSPSPPSFNLSLHQGLFQWGSSLHQVAKVWEFQLQHQYFQWIFRTDFL